MNNTKEMFDEIDLNHLLVAVQEKINRFEKQRERAISGTDSRLVLGLQLDEHRYLEKKILELLA